MNQFLKTYRELYKQGCKPNQVAILTAIFDRMESSRQRHNFYSDTYHDYFVIYTYEELANELNLSTKAIAVLMICKIMLCKIQVVKNSTKVEKFST